MCKRTRQPNRCCLKITSQDGIERFRGHAPGAKPVETHCRPQYPDRHVFDRIFWEVVSVVHEPVFL